MIIAAARTSFIALRVALGYAVFGIVWILGSDHLAALLFPDPATLTAAQSWKGLFFVLSSSLLIFVLGATLMRALAASEQRYRTLFANSPEALILYNMDSLRLVDANAAAGRLLGYEIAELVGRNVAELMTPASLAVLRRELPRIRELPRYSALWQLQHRDGHTLDIAIHGQNWAEGDNHLRQALLIDITARVRAETELLRALDELAATNERMRELGHAISHDLQEPLRQVTSFAQLLERRYADGLDGEGRQFIQYVVEGSTRLKSLLTAVGDFTMPVLTHPQQVDANAIVAEVIDELGRSAGTPQTQITVADLPQVTADPSRLAVVFHILLDNAIKFRRSDIGCEVTVSARSGDSGWEFRIQDNGIGIEPEFRASVFSLFGRLHTRERIPGNGTGLALAKKMVESWGGRIWVEPAPDGGSVFVFTLADKIGAAA